MTILVTGARGAIARNVIDQLLAAGETVRAGSRDPEQTSLPAGVTPVLVDFTKPETLPAALEGVAKVFLYAADGMDAFIAAAKAAGVRHVVLLSSAAADVADDDDLSEEIARMHVLAERPIRQGSIAWTFLRPAMFATNALWWKQSIQEENLVRLPYPEAPVRPIHEVDIAEVAVAALTEPGHEGKIHPIDGPQDLTQRRQVELIAEALGRPIEVRQLPHEVAAKFLPERLLEALATGETFPVGPTSEAVTGKPARTFQQWARDHADDFR